MNRFIILIVIIFCCPKAFSCACSDMNTTELFLRADFVAVAEITKVYANESHKDYYKAEIHIENLYKGKTTDSVFVYGFNNEKNIFSSCDIRLMPGSKWLIFSFNNKSSKIFTGYCSLVRADDFNFKKNNTQQLLNILNQKSSELTNNYFGNSPYLLQERYKTYNSKKIEDYTLVSVKIDSNQRIEKVEFLTDDTKIAKVRIEAEIRKYPFKDYFIKNKINTDKGFFYLFELKPYSNILEPAFITH